MEKFICILIIAFGAHNVFAVDDNATPGSIISDNMGIISDNMTTLTSDNNVTSDGNVTARDNVPDISSLGSESTATFTDNVTTVTSHDNAALSSRVPALFSRDNEDPSSTTNDLTSRDNVASSIRISAVTSRNNVTPRRRVSAVASRDYVASRDKANVASSDDATTESLETFQQLEKRMKSNMGSAVKMILPHLMRGSADARVSGQCTASVLRIIGGVKQLKEWAMRFIDATGKIPAGILEGTSISIGDYDECLDIEVARRDEKPLTPDNIIFKGQYCLLELHRPETINRAIADFENGNLDAPIKKTKTFLNMFVRYKHLTNATMKLGVCVPSKCSMEDVESIMNSGPLQSFLGKVSVPYCKQKGDFEISTVETILACLFGFAIGFMILGTVGDVYFRIRGDSDIKSDSTTLMRLLASKTSIYSNSLSILSADGGTDSLHCLCGFRTLIVMIVIYSHTYAHLHVLHFQKFAKAANFLKFFESFTFSGIGNGSVVLDSMVFVSAVTITYSRWRFLSENGKVKLNIFRLIISRYFRMSAAQLLCICVFMLFPLFGSGPLWSVYVNPMLDNCKQRWWLNILYIHNLWEPQDVCLYHSWILALFFQLTIVGVIVILILKKSRMFGIFFMVLLTLVGVIGVAVMTAVHELPGALAFFMLDIKSFPVAWNDVFTLPYDHVGPFCIALSIGYFLAVKKDKLNISKMTSIILWCISFVCTTSVMFGLYRYKNGDRMYPTIAVLYAVMHRNVWCIGIGWLFVACVTHHGGAFSRFLKSKIFVPFDRLCYITYLIHLPIMYYHSGSIRERMYMGHLDILFLATSYIVLSYVAAFFLHIFFVEPYYHLEEHICSLFGSKDKVSFEPKYNSSKPMTIPNSATLESSTSKNGCVNLGYSKKLDGV